MRERSRDFRFWSLLNWFWDWGPQLSFPFLGKNKPQVQKDSFTGEKSYNEEAKLFFHLWVIFYLHFMELSFFEQLRNCFTDCTMSTPAGKNINIAITQELTAQKDFYLWSMLSSCHLYTWTSNHFYNLQAGRAFVDKNGGFLDTTWLCNFEEKHD